MKKEKRKSMITALIIVILLIGVGYAVINADLSINGTSVIGNANWDIHFENVHTTDFGNVNPVSISSVDPEDKAQTLSYEVVFTEPGQDYELGFDIVNAGSIDAMIDTVSLTMKVGDDDAFEFDYITRHPIFYTYALYEDNVEILDKQLIPHNSRESAVVGIRFKRNISNEQFASVTEKNIIITLTMHFKQADDTAEPIRWSGTKYSTNISAQEGSIVLNDAIFSKTHYFPTPEEAMADLKLKIGDNKDRLYCIENTIEDSITTDGKLIFVVTDEMVNDNPGMTAGTYTLDFVNNAADNAHNREVLEGAFSSAYCEEENGSNPGYSCEISNLEAYTFLNTGIGVGSNDGWYCYFDEDGYGVCEKFW